MTRSARRPTWLVASLLATIVGLASPPSRGQDKPPPAGLDEWKKLEPTPELANYRKQLQAGVFGDDEKTFLQQTALPHIALPKNRPEIDRIRRKMIDRLCVGDPTSDLKAATGAMQTVTDFMVRLAADTKAETVSRVNAVLMIGELRGSANKPWAPAAAALTSIFGNDAMPAAVRIAAASGLARHVDADPTARATDVGPALVKIAGAPLADVDPVAANWLRSRAFSMLARMKDAAPAGTVAAAAQAMLDAARPLDDRVRAAAAVGACVKNPGDTDIAAAVTGIRDLAVAAVSSTKARAERRDLAVQLAGGGPVMREMEFPPEGGLEGEGTGPEQPYRRDAWRLATLADAVAATDGAGGLARFAGAGTDAANTLAKTLREAATLLDEAPDAFALDEVIGKLPAGAPPADAASPIAPASEPAPVDGGGTPFGNP